MRVREHLMNFERVSYVFESGDSPISRDMLDCSYGVNPCGCSSLVANAKKVLTPVDFFNYPQNLYIEVRRKIAQYWKGVISLGINDIRLGNGSIGILSNINKMHIDKGTKVLGYCPQFTDYINDVRCYGGIYDHIKLKKEQNYKFDNIEFMDKINERYRLIYIDNPNNPTGQIISLSQLVPIIEKAKKMNICVIIDEAYGDFMEKDNSAISLIKSYNNLIVTRSFSKGFGLAGLRIGYMVCNRFIMQYYRKVAFPFTVTNLACQAVMLALKDQQFIDDSIRKTKDAKDKLIKACSKIIVWNTSLEVPIMVLQHPDTKIDLYKLFLDKKIITESGYGFPELGKNAVRFRIATNNIERIIEVIKSIEQEM
jgi:histidinol-phosphate aminotransferase